MAWTKVEPEKFDARALNGTSCLAHLEMAPCDVVRIWGPATYVHERPYKVDREWIFRGSVHAAPVVLYAYKATSAYCTEYPDPEDFWKSTQSFPMSVSSRDQASVDSFLQGYYYHMRKRHAELVLENETLRQQLHEMRKLNRHVKRYEGG
jgi:hypothetical protein